MANSRTKILIPMLVLCFFAVTAYGQAVLSLGSNPTRVRTEGITEVVGLITLSNNTNAAQVIPGGTTISIVFDGTITNGSNLTTAAATFDMVGTATGATAPIPGSPSGNVYAVGTGSSTVLGNTGVFATQGHAASIGSTLSISFPTLYGNDGTGPCTSGTAPAGPNTFCLVPGGSLNIQGIRVNVSGIVGNVFGTVTTTPANAVTFPGGINQTVVGRAQATIGSVTPTIAALAQCSIPAAPSATNLGLFFTAGGILSLGAPWTTGQTLRMNVSEPANFATAFTAAGSPTLPTNQWDETGITPGTFAAILGGAYLQGSAAAVTRGVQLVFTLSGIPSGISVIVPALFNQAATTTAPVNSGLSWTQVSPTPGNVLAGQGNILAPTGGVVAVSYELTTTAPASPTTVDVATFQFAFTAPTGTVVPVGSLGTGTVSVGPVSTVTGFSSTASTLRFVANTGVPIGTSIGTITACITNLLFPFVSNRAGTTFNTGMAISNTAKDSGTTVGETGGVTLYFYGISAPTGGSAGIAMPIPSVSAGGTVATSGVVAPGEHTVLALNDGTATAIAAGFQGYIVALCNFRYAHGLATVFDNFGVGAANVGFSYLPLVVSGTIPFPRTGTNNAGGTIGESLGN